MNNDIIDKHKTCASIPQKIKTNNKKTKNPQHILDALNKHFTTVGYNSVNCHSVNTISFTSF